MHWRCALAVIGLLCGMKSLFCLGKVLLVILYFLYACRDICYVAVVLTCCCSHSNIIGVVRRIHVVG